MVPPGTRGRRGRPRGIRRSQGARGQGGARHQDALGLRLRRQAGPGRSRASGRGWRHPRDLPLAVGGPRQGPAATRPVRQASQVTADIPTWAVELLGTARVGRLATASGDGRPLVVPVCYAFDGTRLYSAVDAKPKRTRELRRLRNIAENPRVSLVVDEYDEDWTRLRYVIVEGNAEIVEAGSR